MTTFTLKIPGVGPVQVSNPGKLNVVVPVERVGDHFVVVQRSRGHDHLWSRLHTVKQPPCWLSGKESTARAADLGLIPAFAI